MIGSVDIDINRQPTSHVFFVIVNTPVMVTCGFAMSCRVCTMTKTKSSLNYFITATDLAFQYGNTLLLMLRCDSLIALKVRHELHYMSRDTVMSANYCISLHARLTV